MSQLQSESFKALGTEVQASIICSAEQARPVFAEFRNAVDSFEQRFSRFIVKNELEMLNLAADETVEISEDLMALFQAAQEAYRMSGGLVDVSVGRTMLRIGYDKTFDTIARRNDFDYQASGSNEEFNFSDVILDPENLTITKPSGMHFDFGGIGKGYLLDQLGPLFRNVSANFWLSLGGDLLISGHGQKGASWPVGLQDPSHPERDLGTLNLPIGSYAVAASGVKKRSWPTKQGTKHHIVDPRTDNSTDTDAVIATVVTRLGLTADVLAKTVVILGSKYGLEFLKKYPKTSGVVVTKQNKILMTEDLKPYVSYA